MDENNETVIVASFPKNNAEAICVGVSQFKGKDLVFIRSFAQALDGEGLIPTKSGISLEISKWDVLFSAIKEISKVMTTDKVVSRITKNNSQEIWVGINKFKEIPLIYVRTFSKFKGSDEYKPTKQGISIRVELYSELLEAVILLDKAVKSFIDGDQ